MCFSLQGRAIFQPLIFEKVLRDRQFLTFLIKHVLLATAACNVSTSKLPKVLRDRQFFNILSYKCASRYSGVQILRVRTSKSGPKLMCFVHFDSQLCFSRQWRACASRDSGVPFFHIATSKSGPKLLRFVHFDLQMCFSLQRRAIFHLCSKQLPPHPPLYRAYFSTQPTHESLKKHSDSRLS